MNQLASNPGVVGQLYSDMRAVGHQTHRGHPDWQLPEDKQWELTSYEWNERTGYARFQYTNRRSGELLSRVRWQPNHWTPPKQLEQSQIDRKGKRK